MAMAQPIRNEKKMALLICPVLHHQSRKATTSYIREGITNSASLEDVRTLFKESRLKEALRILHIVDQRLDSSAYVYLLQACINKKALSEGKLVHAHMTEEGFMPDKFLWNTLMNMYSRCGNLPLARRVFDQMLERDAFSWTVMIAAYARHGLGEETLKLFRQMQLSDIQPDQFTFASVLPACTNLAALKDVHEEIIRNGFVSDVFVSSALVDMYAKCGSIEYARNVFDNMSQRDVVSWNGMIAAYARLGLFEEALILFYKMQHAGIQPDQFTFTNALPACTNLSALERGMGFHEKIIKSGFHSDVFVTNALVDMYAKCGHIENARDVFDKMHQRNAISWTSMIAGYTQNGHGEEALKLFQQMQLEGVKPDSKTFASVLPACANLAALEQGMEIHGSIIRSEFHSDVFLVNALVDMYAKCGSIEKARHLFDKMHQRNAVSWTVMIAGYAQNGQSENALKVFRQMKLAGMKPDSKTFASVLPACANSASLEQGSEIHEELIRSGFQSDVFVTNALVDMYAKCGSIEKARDLFDKMQQRNAVSWTSMIAGYAQSGHSEEALKLFQQMQLAGVKPNSNTFASVLPACGNLAALAQGMKIHEELIRIGFQYDVFVDSALVDMYAKCGSIEKARNVFDKMPRRNSVTWTAMVAGYARNGYVEEALTLFQKMPKQDGIAWTAMIAGYVQNGHSMEALRLFRQMQLARVKPDLKTFTSVLPACANLASLEQGMEIHEEIIRSGFQSAVLVVNALVDMYAKCGSIEKARNLFDDMHQRDIVSWTAMIAGYAMHGFGKEALKLFEQMQNSGMNPNHVTLVSVLSACCHSGLVAEGRQYFDYMSQYYHITPAMEHYSCMVDLLGRAGCLDEAQDFINKMPIEPDATVWGCLLSACRTHSNLELGERVANHLFYLDPKNASPYVLLSNIYAGGGRWDDFERVRKMMKDRRVRKTPGCSWIEVNKQVHAFLVGD